MNSLTTQYNVAADEPEYYDLRVISRHQRDEIIISTAMVEGQTVITSRYRDDWWHLGQVPSNRPASLHKLNFKTCPPEFRDISKEIMYRYMRRGRGGTPRPKGSSVHSFFTRSRIFFKHLSSLRISRLKSVTPIIFSNYLNDLRSTPTARGKPISKSNFFQILLMIEGLFELSQYTSDPIPTHPWPDTSAKKIAGLTKNMIDSQRGGRTPLIPDEEFSILFNRAYRLLCEGERLLDIRDQGNRVDGDAHLSAMSKWKYKNRRLEAAGWTESQKILERKLIDLRTACYIVLASTSGCRHHELANLQNNAHFRSKNQEGIIYHWMRSLSQKTNSGVIEWMIPEVSVRALRIMERWAAPYQALIAKEIRIRRSLNPLDPLITEAIKHRRALFLGKCSSTDQCRTLSIRSLSNNLKEFAVSAGISWSLSTHQFRRKFANYVAHSKFGDLRYLREHFAHWNLDMTLLYAMDGDWGKSLDIELYNDIDSELDMAKEKTVASWIDASSLSGGYGKSLKAWLRKPENLTIFSTRQSMIRSLAESTHIRSNGHAWCTADNDTCMGNSMDKTRCSGCQSAVIDSTFSPFYQQLYAQLEELTMLGDIGEAGQSRVQRDLLRCKDVLSGIQNSEQKP